MEHKNEADVYLSKRAYSTENIPKTVRKKTSIWVDEFEWKRFIRNVHSIKSSSCHFIEPYILAVSNSIEKLDSKPILPTSNITLNMDLNVQRVVRRRKILGDTEIKTVYRGSVDQCSECGKMPMYIGGHKADPFTYVKKYLCEECLRFANRYKELQFWDRIKSTSYYFESKESRVKTVVSKCKGVGLRVEVKDFKDWIGIKIG